MKRASSSVSSIRKAQNLTKAFEPLLIDLLPKMRRFACGLTGSTADGDDLCQMTIERALARRNQWQEGTRLDSWMYKIMRNLFIDEIRASRRRGETFVAEEAGLSVGSSGGQEASVELGMIDRAIMRLPDEQREAVLLVMVEGCSYKEAAEIVGCPVGTLNSRLVRGRDALQGLLDDAA
ncbi:RNA polymerase sigma factor [Blastomonas aquatica]|uniref:DNA-directed RNA polymerase sigma-70 factor n=1 Tax=Blastomonas aquatica TaxID=1510276 RepID=A0ABQ1JM68_9SPHN|nr:RNA polymerase sigma factor [Blastomonas aquatica]GGB69923.1 DNA-directed RNA polymerase sigma-70 factor [Blastomonas aquatica]